jgi:very-short-patch-repair endonuclease
VLRRTETDAERRIWKELRGRQFGGLKFRRQQPIGTYIADFCCLSIGLIIELDGGQHAEQIESDVQRTEFLNRRGFTVLRFWNNTVLAETDVVLESIHEAVEALSDHPHPTPLPEGEGDEL